MTSGQARPPSRARSVGTSVRKLAQVATGQPRSKTKERILEVALDLFATQGFDGTTITAIERKVGLAAGTGSLYRHFRSKEELLHAAVEREVVRLLAEAEAERAALEPLDDDEARLTQDYEQCLRDVQRFDRLFRLLLTEGERLPALRATARRALVVGGAGSSWPDDPTVVIAVAALGGYHFMGLMQGGPFQGVARDDFIRSLVTLTHAARRPAAPTASPATRRRRAQA